MSAITKVTSYDGRICLPRIAKFKGAVGYFDSGYDDLLARSNSDGSPIYTLMIRTEGFFSGKRGAQRVYMFASEVDYHNAQQQAVLWAQSVPFTVSVLALGRGSSDTKNCGYIYSDIDQDKRVVD